MIPDRVPVLYYPILPSTQDEALAQLQAGRPTPFVVRADMQSKGRGRQGHVWQSLGGNLAATLCYRLEGPAPDLMQAGDYSFIVAVALRRTMVSALPPDCRVEVKWPNDMMLAGQKCAGILLERPEADLLLIGVGVNLAHAPEGRSALVHFLPQAPAVHDFLLHFLQDFVDVETVYRTRGLPAILEEWRGAVYGLGQDIRVRLPKREFTGRFDGVADDGALLVTVPDGETRRIYAADVFFDAESV